MTMKTGVYVYFIVGFLPIISSLITYLARAASSSIVHWYCEIFWSSHSKLLMLMPSKAQRWIRNIT